MIDFATIPKKLTIGCMISLIIFLVVLIATYRVLHVKNKNFYTNNEILMTEEIPPFKLPVLNNLELFIDHNFLKNKVTLISVWSTNCRTCRHEHAVLLNIAKYLTNKEVNFIGLNCNNNQEQAIEWLKRHGNPYSVNLFDQQGTLVADLGATGLPDFFIIDSYNRIQYKYSGVITTELWEQTIRPILDHIYLHTS